MLTEFAGLTLAPAALVSRLQAEVPGLMALYAFGSRAGHHAQPAAESDLDLAALFEAAILSEKTDLDTARAGLMADILKRGTIYGR